MNHINKSPLVNVLLFSIFWALEIFVAKLAFLTGVQAFQFSLQSFFLTLILLFIYILPSKLKNLKKIPFHTLKWLLLANAILLGIGGFLGNAGIQYTTAVNAGFLTQFAIVTTTIFARIMLNEKITVSKTISVLTIMVGTFLLVTCGKLSLPQIGDVLLLFACIAWGFGPVLIKKMLKNTQIAPDLVSFLRPAAGIPVLLLFIFLSPLYPPSLQKVFQVNIFHVQQPVYVFLNAIFVALTWIFANRSLKIASASYTAMMSSITPILVALLATIFLKEKILGIQFIGILLIIGSSFVTHYAKIDKQQH